VRALAEQDVRPWSGGGLGRADSVAPEPIRVSRSRLPVHGLPIARSLQNPRQAGVTRLPLVQSVCRGVPSVLAPLERCRLVHRDTKPENIVLSDDVSTHVTVIDFGTARSLDELGFLYAQTWYYHALEVALWLPHGTAVGAWSLGGAAVELFVGLKDGAEFFGTRIVSCAFYRSSDWL